MSTYSIKIDEELCWGCKACEVACKQETNAPDGIKLIWISEDGPKIIDGKPSFLFRVNLCRHCQDPECVESCPEQAITKRSDGIVILDQEMCTGCGLCIDACPYEAIAFDHEKNTAIKCNMCFHRIDKGLIPACADNVCLAHCIHFII